jgi:2-oxoglutarate dehydrogenase E1 component
MEGLGPEHSSARLERFLQLCAGDNMQVCNPSTPSQYFHLLRRQMKQSFRKPLIIMTPKSLLRHPLAVSALKGFTTGTFNEVLDDEASYKGASRVLLCSGKIYYGLLKRRDELKRKNTAIVRLEQLYPLPAEKLKTVVNSYKKTKKWYWVQEEPENMGAWQFIRPHLEEILSHPPVYIGRPVAASPATGFPAIYKQQQEAILERSLGTDPNGQVS